MAVVREDFRLDFACRPAQSIRRCPLVHKIFMPFGAHNAIQRPLCVNTSRLRPKCYCKRSGDTRDCCASNLPRWTDETCEFFILDLSIANAGPISEARWFKSATNRRAPAMLKWTLNPPVGARMATIKIRILKTLFCTFFGKRLRGLRQITKCRRRLRCLENWMRHSPN